MGSLNNSNNVTLQITNQAKGSGIEDTKKGLAEVANKSDDTNNRFNLLSKNAEAGLKKVSVATGVLAVGITAYAKSATDYYVDMVKDTNKLARETGSSIDETSKLLAVTKKMGLSAGDTSIAFGTLSKQIVATRDASGDNALKIEDLKNKITAASIQTKTLTEEMKQNGDKSGELHNKIEALNIQIKGYKDQLSATTSPLQKLNVATQNADGSNRSFNDILMSVADKFKSMPDGAEKTAASMELFGKKGKDLIKTLNLGSDGIKDMELQAQKLGLTLSSQNVADVAKYVAAQKQLKDQTDSLKLSVGELTTPVLTSFQTKLNDVVGRLIATDSPFRAATANVLAFGGPVLTATSATTGFLGSLDQALPMLTKVAGFMANPYVAAAVGVAAITGVVAYAILNEKSQAEQLSIANQNLKRDTDALKDSQNRLHDAEMNQQGASLQVESAQRSYNQAVKEFGPKSLEARQAAYNLQVAQDNYKKSVNDTKTALEETQKKAHEVAKDKTLITTLKQTSDEFDGVKKSADGAVFSINKLVEKVNTKQTGAGGQKIDLSPLLKRAKGGPVKPGQGYIVGDNPDGTLNNTSELFLPDQAGTIIPADKTRQMLTPAQASVAPGNQINVTQHVYNQLDYDRGIMELGFRLAGRA